MIPQTEHEKRTAIVVTTIFSPTQSMTEIASGAVREGHEVFVAGDMKGPAQFELNGTTFLSLEDQRDFSELGRRAPTGSYARKNLAYLWAMRSGVDVILETDDDNAPGTSFFTPFPRRLEVRMASSAQWSNIYRYFMNGRRIWPRGLPLEFVQQEMTDVSYEDLPMEYVDAPIQQGLADDDPDVDAVYRMIGDIPVSFIPGRSVALRRGTWCPFNSQNTTWYRDAFQLMYLPSFCTFRMTDIWRSFVAQRIAWVNGWSVMFHSPDVVQDRNDHDLLADFRDEVPGYLHNARIAVVLSDLDLPSGIEYVGEAMRTCYGALIDMDLVGPGEIDLLDLWLTESAGFLV